jgi:hypothetical protein
MALPRRSSSAATSKHSTTMSPESRRGEDRENKNEIPLALLDHHRDPTSARDREARYAEFDPHLGPQVFVPIPDDPEPVHPSTSPSQDNRRSAHSSGEQNVLGSLSRGWTRCQRWVRLNRWFAAGIASGLVCTIALTVVLPVVITSFGSQTSSSSPAASAPSSSPRPLTSQAQASTTSSSPSSVRQMNPTRYFDLQQARTDPSIRLLLPLGAAWTIT